MAERRWEVKIGSTVTATDGDYGHLQQLLVDPHQGRVIALLVWPYKLIPPQTVVAPEAAIADASENEVRLNIGREQVEALPKYWPDSEVVVEGRNCEADDELYAVRRENVFEVGRAPSSREPGMVEGRITGSEGKSFGLRLRAGQQVFCRGVHAGWVSLILLDSSGRVHGFVLHTGHLHLIGRDLIVPAAWVQEVDQQNVHLSVEKRDLENLPDYCSDEVLGAAADNVLWSDEILRNTDYKEIGISAEDGVVSLRGHVVTSRNKRKAEDATRSVPGVLGLVNDLVVDQDLVLDVAQALGKNELTRSERISVGVQNGFITLKGYVDSATIRNAAETIAASVPQVRGVINDLQAPNVIIDPEEQKVRQPRIGQQVYATDMHLGHVESVVIDPRNRRVIAFVTRGCFPDPRNKSNYRTPDDEPGLESRVVIPIDAVRDVTNSPVVLDVSGAETALYRAFDPADLIHPPAEWQPPYPYRREQVFFDRRRLEEPKRENSST